MTLRSKRRRRVELLIDQRLVSFLKPMMTVSNGCRKEIPNGKVTDIRSKRREDKAS